MHEVLIAHLALDHVVFSLLELQFLQLLGQFKFLVFLLLIDVALELLGTQFLPLAGFLDLKLLLLLVAGVLLLHLLESGLDVTSLGLQATILLELVVLQVGLVVLLYLVKLLLLVDDVALRLSNRGLLGVVLVTFVRLQVDLLSLLIDGLVDGHLVHSCLFVLILTILALQVAE